MSDLRVPVVVEATARVPAETAFDVILPIDLPSIFTGMGPLPAVTGTRDQSGPWTRAGESRMVELADGSAVREKLTRVDRADAFAYVLGPFPQPFGLLVADAHGEWRFWGDETSGTTRIRWTYAFLPRRGTRLVVRHVVARLWRRYAEQALGRAVRAAEAAAAASPVSRSGEPAAS